jgi:diadenosine tetraphosphate (Ap4A) HIT family hydrolase
MDLLKIYESENILASLDIFPIRTGHVRIIPKQHFQYFDDLPAKIGLDFFFWSRNLLH